MGKAWGRGFFREGGERCDYGVGLKRKDAAIVLELSLARHYSFTDTGGGEGEEGV